MTASDERLRPRPAERFAGDEHVLDLASTLRALRLEPKAGANGHRQIAMMHHGPVRLVLFAFDAGGNIPQHSAPGWVTIHVLRGVINVRTADAYHVLGEGRLLSLAPGLMHDVEAAVDADMLLGIFPEASTKLSAKTPTQTSPE